MPQPGELIHGKYRILKQLADGGMGTIYEARHEVLGTTVALKMLHPNLAKRSNLAERFLQEARVSATLRSPHIVQVIDVEQGPQGAILVMELLRGETLQALLDRQKRLEQPVAIDYTMQLLEGLEVAHAANVVHRDLKPDNVFLVPSSSGPLLKLLDFGIAKLKTSPEFDRGLTRPGVVMGTPEYMAPEQAFSADTVDARADIYAMGVLLFEMLSGQRPVRGDDPKAIAQKVFSGHVTALSALLPALPLGLVSAVHRAMAPAPKGRFASVAEMRLALMPFVTTTTHASTSVLNPAGLPTLPAPTQPNPGSMPSTPPNGPATPPLPHATPSGFAQPSPLPHAQHPSPAPLPSQPSSPGLQQNLTGTPAPVWPAERSSQVPQTLPPEPANPAAATRAHEPLPQAFSPSAPATTQQHSWAATAPAAPLQQSTVLPDGSYGNTGVASTYGAPPGATAVASVYAPQEFPTATPPPQPYPARTPAKKGAPIGLIALLAALAGGLAVVLFLLLRGKGDEPDSPPVTPPPTAPVVATGQPSMPAVPPTIPTIPPLPPQPGPPPGTQPGSQPGAKPGPRDAGADGSPEGGTGPLGLPLPSALPPLPSALPPLPSALPIPIPQIPGLPI